MKRGHLRHGVLATYRHIVLVALLRHRCDPCVASTRGRQAAARVWRKAGSLRER